MHNRPSGAPAIDEADAYYFKYIDRVPGDDVVRALETQIPAAIAELGRFDEETSLRRYEPGKWTAREVLNHVNDCERVFLARSFWFARGFDTPLPSFDQEVATATAPGDAQSWAAHVDEFRSVREATLSFFRNLPPEAWMRRGIASDMPFTVRALAYIVAGHVDHHVGILRERYHSGAA